MQTHNSLQSLPRLSQTCRTHTSHRRPHRRGVEVVAQAGTEQQQEDLVVSRVSNSGGSRKAFSQVSGKC